ncbi:Glutamate receptor ionotropic, kainate 4 [Halotydeus destructor]|nr:Glutamate receptor ionotropic, kainate 4 [Halotydeus destructor]
MVFEAAKENDMINSNYNWTFITSENVTFRCFKCNAKITVVSAATWWREVKSARNRTSGGDLQTEYYTQLFSALFSTFDLIRRETELVSFKLSEFYHHAEELADAETESFMYVRVDSAHDVLYTEIKFDITEYNFKNGVCVQTELGHYVTGYPSGSFFFREYRQASPTLRVVVMRPAEPFLMKKNMSITGPQTSLDNYEGFLVDYFNMIQQELGSERFNLEVLEASMVNTSSVATLYDILAHGHADLALADITVTAPRRERISFTLPFMSTALVIVMKKQSSTLSYTFKYVTIFEPKLWLAFAIAYVMAAFFTHVLDMLSPQSARNVLRRNEEKLDPWRVRIFTIAESFWFCLISLTPQGVAGPSPRSVAGRFFAATWWLFGFVIIQAHQANIASFLSTTRTEKRLSSLDDIAGQYKVQYGAINGTSAMTYFETMANVEEALSKEWLKLIFYSNITDSERDMLSVWEYPVPEKYSRIWKVMNSLGMPRTHGEALAKVKDGSFALITDETLALHFTKSTCDLEIVGQPMARSPLALGLPKDSPYKDVLDHAISKLTAKMALDQLYYKWWTNNGQLKQCDRRPRHHGLNLSALIGLFAIIAVGLLVSLFILFIENVYFENAPQYGRQKCAQLTFRSD